MNTTFEVLVWKKYEYEEQLGCPQDETGFDGYDKAIKYYDTVKKYLCKILMEYESLEPDSDGDVLEEDWNE